MFASADLTKPPQGYYESAWHLASAAFPDPTQFSRHYVKFDFPDTVFHREPVRLEPELHWAFQWAMQSKPLPQFVAVIPGGRLAGTSGPAILTHGAVISPDNKLIWDVSFEFHATPLLHTIFRRPQLPPPVYLPGSIAVLTSTATGNYYHWMFDTLAKIDLLRRSGIAVDKYLINRQGFLPFQYATLSVVGIPPHQLMECDLTTHVQAERLVVPSLPGYSGHPPKWACDFLRHELLTKRGISPIGGYERIYISRGDRGMRIIVNERELVNVLSGYGFRIVKPERHSVYEQAQIFSSAQVVVAPHGAGLTNLVFCRPGTKVLEILSPQYVNPVYYILSNQMGLHYAYLLGEGPRPSPQEYRHVFNANITVNVLAFRALLEKVLGV